MNTPPPRPGPDLMEQAFDAMARGDHSEGIKLAQEYNRQMSAHLDAKWSVEEPK